jgi:hypothetical protein
MASDKYSYFERYPLCSAVGVVLFFVIVCLGGAYYSLEKCKSFFEIFPNKVNEWGDFLAGIFAPAALFFLALSVRIQSRELGAAVDAQKEMKREMASQVSQMKFGGMAPFFHDQIKIMYEKFDEGTIKNLTLVKESSNFHSNTTAELNKIIQESVEFDIIYNKIYNSEIILWGDHNEIQKYIEIKNSLRNHYAMYRELISKRNDFSVYIEAFLFLKKLYKSVDNSDEGFSVLENSIYGQTYAALIMVRDCFDVIEKIDSQAKMAREKINSYRDSLSSKGYSGFI